MAMSESFANTTFGSGAPRMNATNLPAIHCIALARVLPVVASVPQCFALPFHTEIEIPETFCFESVTADAN